MKKSLKMKKILQNDALEMHFRIQSSQKKALLRLQIKSIKDLIYYFPTRYSDLSKRVLIKDVKVGQEATIVGEISNLKSGKTFRGQTSKSTATLKDSTGTAQIIWFHQPYLAKMLKPGQIVKLSGKIGDYKDSVSLINPIVEKEESLPIDIGDTLFTGHDNLDIRYPIYKESKGITSRWIYHTLRKIFSSNAHADIKEYLPEDILDRYNLPALHTALTWIHFPKSTKHFESARKRFAFEEIFFIQLSHQKSRHESSEIGATPIRNSLAHSQDFISRSHLTPTFAQARSIKNICNDLDSIKPMSRLLEGDVGSGKTFVAAATIEGAIKTTPPEKDYGTVQVAYMTPTEILSVQQFDSFIETFKSSGIKIGLLTSSTCRVYPSKVNPSTWTAISKTQLKKWISSGEIALVVGTHSLIQKTVDFRYLAYVIIDEQHRFGLAQRRALVTQNGSLPHLLSMTATPIPRTLALTIYGDLDLSVLDEMPPGRKNVITTLINKKNAKKMYEDITKRLEMGFQAYVICPRIVDPDPAKESALRVKSVLTEAERLAKNEFKNYRVRPLHSKIKKSEKEQIMQDFYDKKIDVLVSTSVIEVGINVPNSTSIIIEGAERFGLSQLHQLRGRVVRSTDQSYCYVVSDSATEKSTERLKIFVSSHDGFELAEKDLLTRGAGELSGTKQWGISDLGMEALRNIKMVEAARVESQKIIKEDPTMSSCKLLSKKLEERELSIHFE